MHKPYKHKSGGKKVVKYRGSSKPPKVEEKVDTLKPVSTIIQSLATMSNLKIEDIVKHLVRDRNLALGNGRTIKRNPKKKNRTMTKKVKSGGSHKPMSLGKSATSPIRKNNFSPQQPRKKSGGSPLVYRVLRVERPETLLNKENTLLPLIKEANARMALLRQNTTISSGNHINIETEKKSDTVIKRENPPETTVTEASTSLKTIVKQQITAEKKENVAQKQANSSTLEERRKNLQERREVLMSLKGKDSREFAIVKKESAVKNVEHCDTKVAKPATENTTAASTVTIDATKELPSSLPTNTILVTMPTGDKKSQSLEAKTTVKEPTSQLPSSTKSKDHGDVVNSKTVHDLKIQLINRFNQRRLEEKAQLNQEKLSQINVEAVPEKMSIQPSSGVLVNLGIGLKRSEMLEKEYATVSLLVTKKRYLELKLKAEEALRKEMTFAICGRSNGWSTVRRFFLMRNWVERFDNGEDKKVALPGLGVAPDNDTNVLSRLVARLPVKYIWSEINLNWTLVGSDTIVNKFPASIRPLSTKVGLLLHLNNQVWIYNPNYSYVKFPRSHAIYDEDDMRHFSDQFRMTACVCLLKYLEDSYEQGREWAAPNGTVPLDSADFAVQRVCEFVTFKENSDLDSWHSCLISEDEWTVFLLRFHDIIHFGTKFKLETAFNIQKLVTCAKLCLKQVREFWPDVDVEGYRNLWIVKPSASSCGKGIRIFKTLDEIKTHCKPGYSYLAQKYIERPMCVHKTKFDIRQWFVVTSIKPLVIYLYEICYLRFCSREFSLVNLHESIHLSNNAVQCRYANMTTRSSELPTDNMWDSDTFLNYLRLRKEDDKWYAITVPGIRKGITGALLASQNLLTNRENSFNLFGADFMLTEDFIPWLIEINNGPCLRPTTSVTARLCPMVIEDTCQLVLKVKHGPTKASLPPSPGHLSECGKFRLIYAQTVAPNPASTARLDLVVPAKRARIHLERNTVERRKATAAVPMFQDGEDESPPRSYDHRTLKYEKVANYKQQPIATTARALIYDDLKRPPIPPGGIMPPGLPEFKGTYQKLESILASLKTENKPTALT